MVFIKYRLSKIGIIQRIELPAIPTKYGVAIDRSTVDYIGHFKGHPIAFDAKESKDERVNIKSNLKMHQIEFLHYWKDSAPSDLKIMSGFVINFYEYDKDYVYFLDIDLLQSKINQGAKSILRGEIPHRFKLDDTLLDEVFKCI